MVYCSCKVSPCRRSVCLRGLCRRVKYRRTFGVVAVKIDRLQKLRLPKKQREPSPDEDFNCCHGFTVVAVRTIGPP
ncbi:hypothetical protein GBAR_LOCUS2156, partial [Geodia barretti]